MKIVSIGRDSVNQIVFNDKRVSRFHAHLIILDNDHARIKDLGSTNGIFVNGKRVFECNLNPGDIVKCASVFLNWPSLITTKQMKDANSVKSIPLFADNISNSKYEIYRQNSSSNSPKSNRILHSYKSKAGFVLTIIGFILILISSQNELFTKEVKLRVDPAAYGVPEAFNLMGPVYEEHKILDTKSKNVFLYTGFLCLIAGVIYFDRGKQHNYIR